MKILLTALFFICGNACAMTGNQFMQLLQSGDSSRVWQAHRYLEAVVDTEATMVGSYRQVLEKNKEKKLATALFCTPSGQSTAKTMEEVAPRLAAEVATLPQSANVLIRRTLITVWPCAENP